MFRVTGVAISRASEIGGMVESFIDSNSHNFSIEQLEMLESLAEEVDAAANEKEKELEELKEHEEFLLNENKELREAQQ